MTAHQGERRRTALSTLGRASRGLTCFLDANPAILLAGTALAGTDNELHVLAHEGGGNTLQSIFVLKAPAEIWSLDKASGGNSDSKILVAARRGAQSAIEVWDLPDLSNVDELLLTPKDENDRKTSSVNVISSTNVVGMLFKARANPFEASEALSLTQTDFRIVNMNGSSKQAQAGQLFHRNHMSRDAHESNLVIDGEWIDANTAMLACQADLRIFDTRSGKAQTHLVVKDILEHSGHGPESFWIPQHPSRISSSCCGPQGALYAGFQDGRLRSFDIRKPGIVWEKRHSKNHWVSAVRSFPGGEVLSGGTDGVVKCWGQDGMGIATFPHHDDTVTSASCSSKLFATISFDGRIALNELPA